MANIDSYLAKIREAVYGEEVRGSIHDAIAAMNAELINSDQVHLRNSIASQYNSSTTYAVGDYVFYPSDGILYRCIKAGSGHTPGSSSTYWASVELSDIITALSNDLNEGSVCVNKIMSQGKRVQFLKADDWDAGYYYEIQANGNFSKTPTPVTDFKTQAIYALPAGTYYYNAIFQNFTIIRDLNTGEYHNCTEYGMATVFGSEVSVTISHPFNIYITINTGAEYAMFANDQLPAKYRYGFYGDLEFGMYVRSLINGKVDYVSQAAPEYLMSISYIDCTEKAKFAVCKSPNFNMFYIKFNADNTHNSWGFVNTNSDVLPVGYKYIIGIVRVNDDLPIPTINDSVYVKVFETGISCVTVSANGADPIAHFSRIQNAVDYLPDNGTLYVMNGTYNESVDMVTKSLTMIGEDRDRTIVVMHTDLYNMAPLEAAKGLVENMSFIVDDTARPSTTEDRAYAVHTDWDESYQNDLTFRNCRMVSKNRPAIGIGTRPYSTLRLENCELVSTEYVTLFMHNSANTNYLGPEQLLVLDNCKLYAPNYSHCILIQKCYDTNNSAEIRSLNSLYIANGAIPTAWQDDMPHVGTGSATITVAADSFGNNASHMDGSLIKG